MAKVLQVTFEYRVFSAYFRGEPSIRILRNRGVTIPIARQCGNPECIGLWALVGTLSGPQEIVQNIERFVGSKPYTLSTSLGSLCHPYDRTRLDFTTPIARVWHDCTCEEQQQEHREMRDNAWLY